MKNPDSIWAKMAIVAFACCASTFSTIASTNVVVWDIPRGDAFKPRKVPSNLMELEKDPLKSASDPGYYGRDYIFTGDVAIENSLVRAVLLRSSGRVTVQTPAYPSTTNATANDDLTDPKAPKICFGQIVPVTSEKPTGFELIRNGADEAVLRADYA